ncbi:hypothetical protein Glove_144g115 [Diversispora epigaea]|uniref:Uncharacterized protein n=1 Tax=Diversispora epigaea TaxID=1348612 RepID=A0A397IWT6_9GLOM|nr:hypothetical protein Glove_144g115 [Diversispora epigaea]
MVGPISISFIIVTAVIFAFTTFDNPVTSCSLPTCIDDDDDNITCQVMMEDEGYDTDVEVTEYDYFRDYDWSYEENYDMDDSRKIEILQIKETKNFRQEFTLHDKLMVGPISISFIIVTAVIFAFTTFDNPVTSCSLPTCIDDDDDNITCQVMMEDEGYDTDVEVTEYDYFRDYDWSYEENYDMDDSSSGTTIYETD